MAELEARSGAGEPRRPRPAGRAAGSRTVARGTWRGSRPTCRAAAKRGGPGSPHPREAPWKGGGSLGDGAAADLGELQLLPRGGGDDQGDHGQVAVRGLGVAAVALLGPGRGLLRGPAGRLALAPGPGRRAGPVGLLHAPVRLKSARSPPPQGGGLNGPLAPADGADPTAPGPEGAGWCFPPPRPAEPMRSPKASRPAPRAVD